MSKSVFKSNVFFLIMFMVSLASCSEKKQFMNSFEQFVSQVEADCATYTLDEWKWSFDEFRVYEEQFETYKEKMSSDEIAAVNDCEKRYLRALSHAPRNMMSNLKSYISPFMDEEGEGRNLLQKFGEDFDEVVSDIEDFIDMFRQ